MSAFGLPINFWAGLAMSVFTAAAAIDLLWRSIYTSGWNTWAKSTGTALIVLLTLIVVNEGYVHTHRVQNPNAETLSAIQNLSNLVGKLQSSGTPEIRQNTQIIDVDGKYPDIQLSEPRDVPVSNGSPLVNIDVKNIGNATALAKRETAGLFIAPLGSSYEDSIFRYLYKRERDKGKDIPSDDLAPTDGGILPISGPVMREDGEKVEDQDRRALYEKTKVLYAAVLVGYQDQRGHIFHKELCYSYTDTQSLSRKCTGHNGHG